MGKKTTKTRNPYHAPHFVSGIPEVEIVERPRRKERVKVEEEGTGFDWWKVVLGMLIAFLLFVGGNAAWGWGQTQWWNIHYGNPRTSQTDAVVGHVNGQGMSDSALTPSHFIAINMHGVVEVIEFPAGDATKALIYIIPSQYDEKAPVDVSFKDVNGDGKKDLLISIHQNETHMVIILNDGKQFNMKLPLPQDVKV